MYTESPSLTDVYVVNFKSIRNDELEKTNVILWLDRNLFSFFIEEIIDLGVYT